MIPKKTRREWLDFCCQFLSIAWATGETVFVLVPTFFAAYSNGWNGGEYSVTIYVNHFGEANFEMALLCIMTPIILYGTYLNLKLIDKYAYWGEEHG